MKSTRSSRAVLLPVSRVRPGQEFTHSGQAYRRATEDEMHKHPGRENPRFIHRGDVVLAYGLSNQPVPVTFVDDARVLVRGGR